jgi:hypothetical protein
VAALYDAVTAGNMVEERRLHAVLKAAKLLEPSAAAA